MAKVLPLKKEDQDSLVGYFGFTLDKEGAIRWQFEIIRKMTFGRYVVQLFSWADGCPTEIKVISEHVLLSKQAKLYATHELWRHAAEVNHR